MTTATVRDGYRSSGQLGPRREGGFASIRKTADGSQLRTTQPVQHDVERRPRRTLDQAVLNAPREQPLPDRPASRPARSATSVSSSIGSA